MSQRSHSSASRSHSPSGSRSPSRSPGSSRSRSPSPRSASRSPSRSRSPSPSNHSSHSSRSHHSASQEQQRSDSALNTDSAIRVKTGGETVSLVIPEAERRGKEVLQDAAPLDTGFIVRHTYPASYYVVKIGPMRFDLSLSYLSRVSAWPRQVDADLQLLLVLLTSNKRRRVHIAIEGLQILYEKFGTQVVRKRPDVITRLQQKLHTLAFSQLPDTDNERLFHTDAMTTILQLLYDLSLDDDKVLIEGVCSPVGVAVLSVCMSFDNEILRIATDILVRAVKKDVQRIIKLYADADKAVSKARNKMAKRGIYAQLDREAVLPRSRLVGLAQMLTHQLKYTNYEEDLTNQLRVLTQLGNDVDNCALAVRLNAMQNLVELMDVKHSKVNVMAAEAAGALCVMQKEHQDKLREAKGLESLNSLFCDSRGTYQATIASAMALALIANSDSCKAMLAQPGFLDHLAQALQPRRPTVVRSAALNIVFAFVYGDGKERRDSVPDLARRLGDSVWGGVQSLKDCRKTDGLWSDIQRRIRELEETMERYHIRNLLSGRYAGDANANSDVEDAASDVPADHTELSLSRSASHDTSRPGSMRMRPSGSLKRLPTTLARKPQEDTSVPRQDAAQPARSRSHSQRSTSHSSHSKYSRSESSHSDISPAVGQQRSRSRSRSPSPHRAAAPPAGPKSAREMLEAIKHDVAAKTERVGHGSRSPSPTSQRSHSPSRSRSPSPHSRSGSHMSGSQRSQGSARSGGSAHSGSQRSQGSARSGSPRSGSASPRSGSRHSHSRSGSNVSGGQHSRSGSQHSRSGSQHSRSGSHYSSRSGSPRSGSNMSHSHSSRSDQD